MPTTRRILALALSFTLSSACSTATGDVDLVVQAEDTITEGILPGEDAENIVDGWTVNFSRYVVAIGRVHLHQGATLEASDPAVHVVDLASVSEDGFALTSFDGIATGRWDGVEFETAAPGADAIRDASVTQAELDEMIAGGCSYLIEGALSSPTGQACVPGSACVSATEIGFRFCVPATSVFGPCNTPDGLPGLVVNAGLTTTNAITIHGDHMFFSAFPSGDELVDRRAQWLANCDTDGDGDVTQAELEAADPALIFPAPEYSLAGAPRPIQSAWDFLIAQVKTQGHWNGEGECLVDGEGHEH
jgi:hypothetical protein